MGKKQGLELLVEASRRLAGRDGIQFVFCGEGSYRDTLVRMAQGSRNVMFLPLQPAERLNDLLGLADIHLLPQRADAGDLVMPSKLAGMLASGRPIVATANPGTQVFQDLGGRGIVTPPGNVDAFAAGVARLAEDRHLRGRLGDEARNYAIRRLNRDEILCQFELELLEACGQRRAKDHEERTAGKSRKHPAA
jgi:colanic acid biosynthesis glycosyl transferase WcaI